MYIDDNFPKGCTDKVTQSACYKRSNHCFVLVVYILQMVALL